MKFIIHLLASICFLSKVLLTASSLVALLLLQSCTEDDGSGCGELQTETYNLSEADKAQIPYTGFDTIKMASNAGDSIACIGAGKQYFTTSEYVPHINPDCAGKGGTKTTYDGYIINFNGKADIDNIKIRHSGKLPYKNGSLPNCVLFSFHGKNFYIADYDISSKRLSTFIGSGMVNGKLYENISRVNNEANDTTSYLWLNKNDGILKISLNGSEVWQLTN
ncbi:MAG: hypothetical protein V4590_05305 [Bacteroidota bacterium]